MNSIKRDFISGVFFTSIAKYSNLLVQILVSAILARLLTPEDYGLVAIVTVFIAFFNILSDIGIGPAIIQNKDLSEHDLNSIYSFTIYVGILLTIVFFLLSWPIAKFYGNPSLEPVSQFLSLVVLFTCFNIVPQNLQYKKKKFKFTGFVTFIVHILTALIAIVSALLGFGVYALVLQQVLSIIFIYITFRYKERLSFVFTPSKNSLRKIMSFSIYQFLFNIINYFSRNLDKLLIGRFVGLGPLGQYEKSYKLMMLPLSNITFAVTPVIQPIFSDMQSDLYEMALKYKKVFVFLCYVGFPLSAFLFFSSEELIMLFFGNQWHEAVAPFQILSLTVGLQILNGTSGAIYQSANATKRLFISGCWCAFFMITSFTISIIGWGTITAVAFGYVVAQILNSAQTYYLLFRTLRYPLVDILKSMVRPLLLAIFISLVLSVFLRIKFAEMWISLIFKGVSALVVWLAGIEFFSPYKGLAKRIVTRKIN